VKPNILLIMADQLAARFLPAYGNAVVKAPNLDRLGAEGVVFENSYSNSPLCVPARAVALSGLLPSRTGVYDNAAEFSAEIPTFAHYARLQGYRTCLAGKLHAIGPDQLHGFEERLTTDIYPADFGWTPDWRLRGGERIDWWNHNMSSVKQAGTAEITNQLEYDDEVAFLANRQIFDWTRYRRDEPFLLKVSFTHPHDPYVNRRRFFDLYGDGDIPPPTVGPIPYAELDPHERRLYDMNAGGDYVITEDDVRAARRGYCASISYVDSLIGSLIETLAICGRLDDTIVIFTSDHGDFLGERGLWYKMSFREPAARIPLIVWQPGLFQPRRVHQPVSLADLAPTIAALTGTSQLVAPVDGINLKPLLEGGPEDPDATVYGEYLAEGVIAPMYMLRRGRWKFIHTPSDPDQLFDLVADPLERVNRAADEPALAAAFQQEIESRFDIAAISRKVRDSQRARHLIFAALGEGSTTSWDFQPRRDAATQYTRNTLDVTSRDQQSRFPPAPPLPPRR
jgi:choline-sulfatase